jgi:hypothetical protein
MLSRRGTEEHPVRVMLAGNVRFYFAHHYHFLDRVGRLDFRTPKIETINRVRFGGTKKLGEAVHGASQGFAEADA